MPAYYDTDIIDYSVLLRQYGFSYVERDLWLEVGKPAPGGKWLIVISVIRVQMFELSALVLPALSSLGISFRMVKNRLLHQHINIGRYGNARIGRTFTLYTVSEEQAQELVGILLPLLKGFKGPGIDYGIQLGPALYACYYEKNGAKKKLYVPSRSRIPFKAAGQRIKKRQTKRIIGKHYLVIKRIRVSAKGNIYKALDLSRLLSGWCIVKEGRCNMVDDLAGRTIRDRLLWQEKILTALYGKVPVPKTRALIEEKGDTYLVMEHIRGKALSRMIISIYGCRTWREIGYHARVSILEYYLKCLYLVERIHVNGYIHRDIKDGNFLVQPDGEPFILDFEVAYSLNALEPAPPFKMVAPGYQAPEQLANALPTAKEDIYSLGALLLFLVTGIAPEKVLKEYQPERRLDALTVPKAITDIIFECMEDNPLRRPEMPELIRRISDHIRSDDLRDIT